MGFVKSNNPMFSFDLGKTAKDKTTGFEGVIVARTECLFHNNTYCVMPPVEGPININITEAKWFSESRLEITGDIKQP